MFDAIAAIHTLREQGVGATVCLLGEHPRTASQCEETLCQYYNLIRLLRDQAPGAEISVKPTQLGLELGVHHFHQRALALVSQAAEHSIFVRLDMEGSSCTDATFELYRRLRLRFDNVGVAVQAMLHRSSSDVEELIKMKANVRVCKGIYREPRTIAYQKSSEIIGRFIRLQIQLFRGGCFVSTASHNRRVIAMTERQRLGFDDPDSHHRYEWLYGVRIKQRQNLISLGRTVVVYVTYGRDWRPFVLRRIDENPLIAWEVGQDLLLGR